MKPAASRSRALSRQCGGIARKVGDAVQTIGHPHAPMVCQEFFEFLNRPVRKPGISCFSACIAHDALFRKSEKTAPIGDADGGVTNPPAREAASAAAADGSAAAWFWVWSSDRALSIDLRYSLDMSKARFA